MTDVIYFYLKGMTQDKSSKGNFCELGSIMHDSSVLIGSKFVLKPNIRQSGSIKGTQDFKKQTNKRRMSVHTYVTFICNNM